MKKVETKNNENLIEAKVNKLKGRAKSHKIEWTEKTWNPSAGCTKISSGCKNCYAETMANTFTRQWVWMAMKMALNLILFQADLTTLLKEKRRLSIL